MLYGGVRQQLPLAWVDVLLRYGSKSVGWRSIVMPMFFCCFFFVCLCVCVCGVCVWLCVCVCVFWLEWDAVFSYSLIFFFQNYFWIVSSNHSSAFWHEMGQYYSTWVPKSNQHYIASRWRQLKLLGRWGTSSSPLLWLGFCFRVNEISSPVTIQLKNLFKFKNPPTILLLRSSWMPFASLSAVSALT